MRIYIPDGYEISKHRYMELLSLCRQYDELRKRRDACYGIGSPCLSDTPRGGAKTSIVERQADAARKYSEKIDRIETAAKQAAEGSDVMLRCLMQNVTRGVSYERMNCPCGRKQFYTMRRKFFFILDQS